MYADEGNATEALTNMLDAGYDGTLVSGEADGAIYYELILGPFADLQEANDAAAVLNEVYGYSPTVTVIEEAPRVDDGGER